MACPAKGMFHTYSKADIFTLPALKPISQIATYKHLAESCAKE